MILRSKTSKKTLRVIVSASSDQTAKRTQAKTLKIALTQNSPLNTFQVSNSITQDFKDVLNNHNNFVDQNEMRVSVSKPLPSLIKGKESNTIRSEVLLSGEDLLCTEKLEIHDRDKEKVSSNFNHPSETSPTAQILAAETSPGGVVNDEEFEVEMNEDEH
jgi:hypothetical protein